MSATNELFDRWKAHKGIGSDRQAAAALGVSHAGPAQWRAGRNGSASVIERMAKDLGEDPVPVILQAFAEAARDAEDKRALVRMAKKLAASGLALLLAWMPFFAPTADAVNVLGNSRDIHYAQRAVRIILMWLSRVRPSLRVRPPRLQPHDMEPVTCNRPALCQSNP